MIDLSTEQLTKIYNDANGISGGKNPPISTERIFKAMQACYVIGAQEQKEKDLKICDRLHRKYGPNEMSGHFDSDNGFYIREVSTAIRKGE